MTQLYDIVRFQQSGPTVLIKARVTLEAAQAHCQRADTRGPGWFDGYKKVPDLNYFGNPYRKSAGLLEQAYVELLRERGRYVV